jgi:hypothetical protein
MTPRITDAKYLKDYTLYLSFCNGSGGEVDLEHELDGEIFEPLKDISYFKDFRVNQELHTIVWPNGADFAPEFLFEKLKVPA